MVVDTEMIEAGEGKEEEEDAPKAAVAEKKQPKGWAYKEDPYTYVDPTHPNVQRCLYVPFLLYHLPSDS